MPSVFPVAAHPRMKSACGHECTPFSPTGIVFSPACIGEKSAHPSGSPDATGAPLAVTARKSPRCPLSSAPCTCWSHASAYPRFTPQGGVGGGGEVYVSKCVESCTLG